MARRGGMFVNKPMEYQEGSEPAVLGGAPAAAVSSKDQRMAELGFDDSDEPDYVSDGGGSAPASPAQPGGLASLELKQLLAASEASGKEAKDALLEERRKNAEMQKKFDQLKSSTSGQMAFMRRKLEENYQNKLDELETELDEARDESTALRLQTKMLVEHIEGGQGAAQPVPAGFLNTSVEHQSDVESRHVSKLKKELAKRDAELRRYESDMAALREHHVGPAMEGVEALRRELEASQGECERLKLFIDSFGDDAAPAGGGGGGGAEVAALQRQVATLQDQLQQARQQAPPAPAASPSGPERSVSPVVMTDDLVSILESVHAD